MNGPLVDPGYVSTKPYHAMTAAEKTEHQDVRDAIIAHPDLSVPDKIARLRSPSVEPTAEEYALLLDLRTRIIEGYLDEAASVWFGHKTATDPAFAHAGAGEIEDWNEDRVVLRYYRHRGDYYRDIDSWTTLTIPIEDLLPTYGASRAALKAMAGRPR